MSSTSSHDRIASMLQVLLGQFLGIPAAEIDNDVSFLELGAESLLLLQISQGIQDKFGIKVPFRMLMEEYTTINELAAHLEHALPADELPAAPVAAPAPVAPLPAPTHAVAPAPAPVAAQPAYVPALFAPAPIATEPLPEIPTGAGASSLERVMSMQLRVMAQQLDLLRQAPRTGQAPPALAAPATAPATAPTPVAKVESPAAAPAPAPVAAPEAAAPAPATTAAPSTSNEYVAFQPIRKGTRGGLTESQQQYIADLTARLTKRTAKSKQHIQDYRYPFADSRTVTGFRLAWKELCYPIVVERGAGSHIWDIDGNEYVDLTMGFGALLFGHTPPFVVEAINRELALGNRLGPQSYLAGKVAKLFCEITGTERMAYCNSGTEAIMTAMRLARTVTKRDRIVLFPGSYHGTSDSTLMRADQLPDGRLKAVPQAPGIPLSMAGEVLMLRYDHPESLEILRAEGHTIAAVLVEPPRSRRPDVQPVDFLRQVREITEQTGTAFIMDEVVTGFRTHLGGIQALFGIKADIITYGKTVGGGMPIGVVAGKAMYLDAIDGGGNWQYGDDSYPEADTTFYAGTFCKHSLTTAAMWAVLNHLKESGPQLQEQLNARCSQLVKTLNAFLEAEQYPIRVIHFASWFRFYYAPELRYMDLFFFHLLEKGIYVWEGRNCFISTAHTDEDLDHIVRVVKESLTAMRAAGFLDAPRAEAPKSIVDLEVRTKAAPPPASRQVALTTAQQHLLAAARLGDDASAAYNQSMLLELKGAVNTQALEQALQTVVDRHEALRVSFSPQGDYQRIAPSLQVSLPVVDFSHLERKAREAQVNAWLDQEARQAFDLEAGPLVRAALLKLEDRLYLFVITLHHLITDGQSNGTVLREMAALYSSYCVGATPALPQPTPFSDYVAWLTSPTQQTAHQAAEAYWLNRFQGMLPILELPTDHPRPPAQTFVGARQNLTLGPALRQALQRLGAKLGCTMYVTLLGAFQALLHRLSGQDDIVVGIPVAGQAALGAEALVGYCLNVLPMRATFNHTLTSIDHLKAVRRALLDAYDHQNYPFGLLIKKLNPPRDPSRSPLITVSFNLDRTGSAPQMHHLESELVMLDSHTSAFDLALNVADDNECLLLECAHNTDLFEAATIARWLKHFEVMLLELTAHPEQRLDELPLLAPAERQKLVADWNPPLSTDLAQPGVVALFEAQVAQSPTAPAITFETQTLTYQALNAQANQLARYLRQHGVGPEVRVGVCLERSPQLMIALLAILKAGGAYLPLDPTYPTDRLTFMLADAQVAILLTQTTLQHLPAAGVRVVYMDAEAAVIQSQGPDNLPALTTPQNLAYIIYTSGSTGKPKGVMVSHAGLNNLCTAQVQAFGLQATDRVLQLASFSFDAAISEILMAWRAGATLCLGTQETLRPGAEFVQWLTEQAITKMTISPSALAALPQTELPNLRTIVVAGEACAPELAARWAPGRRFFNAYGPTEATVCATIAEYRPNLHQLPIGRPIARVQVYVLDEHLQPVPPGVAGELHISAIGLARGYFGRPDLTAEKFIPHPLSTVPGARLYKTGDRARYRADGNLEFLGRIDHQVKVRGFRIELGEIEATLAQYAGLQDAAVIVREDVPGDKRLVAYLISSAAQTPGPSDLRAFLAKRLPNYMLPSAFVFLAALPLTPNGKVDRRALPAPTQDRPELGQSYVAPLTVIEKQLAQLWKQVLQVEKIGINDNFFELGGDSILGLQVIARANALGLQITSKQIFQHQTIATLATVVQQAPRTQVEQGLVTGPVPLIPIQRQFFAWPIVERHQWNQSFLLTVNQNLDTAKWLAIFAHLLTHHDALRLRFTQSPTGWQQVNSAAITPVPFTRFDLAHLPPAEQATELTATAARLQGSLNLTDGPLMQVALFDFGSRPGRLFWVVHHLAVDIFSWRVLMEDLETLCQQAQANQPFKLPTKTTPYKQWAEYLVEYARSAPLQAELAYWREILAQPVAALPVDFPEGVAHNTEASRQTVTVDLEVAETQALLQQVPKTYHTQINDALLAALAEAMAAWTGQRVLLVDLEGHGREVLYPEVNLSRTVGWFTSIFPVLLNVETATEPGALLKTVKEQLRRYPNGGIGYGILRQLSPAPETQAFFQTAPKAQMSFNYLGQFSQTTAEPSGWFSDATEARGVEHNPQSLRPYLVEINGAVNDQQFSLSWSYSPHIHRRETIEKVAQAFIRALRAIIAHCQTPTAGGVTPSDFALAKLNQKKLDNVLSKVKFNKRG